MSNQVINLETYRFAQNYSNPSSAYTLLMQQKPMPSKTNFSKYVATFMYNDQISNKLDKLL